MVSDNVRCVGQQHASLDCAGTIPVRDLAYSEGSVASQFVYCLMVHSSQRASKLKLIKLRPSAAESANC